MYGPARCLPLSLRLERAMIGALVVESFELSEYVGGGNRGVVGGLEMEKKGDGEKQRGSGARSKCVCHQPLPIDELQASIRLVRNTINSDGHGSD